MTLYKPKNSQPKIIKIKQSKFISYLRMCESTQEFKSWLSQIKRDHYDSSHVCWAYALHREQSIDYHCSDGGEPSGTAGKPILSTIKTNNLIQAGVIVVRYFGGTRLGKKGLIEAYRSAADNVIGCGETIKWTNTFKYSMTFPLRYYGEVHGYLSRLEVKIIKHTSNDYCELVIEIGNSNKINLEQNLLDITRGDCCMKKID